jgi:predicted ATPase
VARTGDGVTRSTPAGTAPLAATLIGRDNDMAGLLPHLDHAATGSGGTLFLTGAGGVGKTRLADALADEARRRRFRIAAGRAFAAESGVPYALFADALVPVIRDLDPAELDSLTRDVRSELALVIPALGTGDRLRSEDPAELRGRLLWSVTEFVQNLASRRPLLLQLDDVHWADVSSLELLHFLARETRAPS